MRRAMGYWRAKEYYRATANPYGAAAAFLLVLMVLRSEDPGFALVAVFILVAIGTPLAYAFLQVGARLKEVLPAARTSVPVSLSRYRAFQIIFLAGLAVGCGIFAFAAEADAFVPFFAVCLTSAIAHGIAGLRVDAYESRTSTTLLLSPGTSLLGVRRDESEFFALTNEPAVAR
jgi:hypothetical protein